MAGAMSSPSDDRLAARQKVVGVGLWHARVRELETLYEASLGLGYLVWLLVAMGAVTALPLLWFTHAARRSR